MEMKCVKREFNFEIYQLRIELTQSTVAKALLDVGNIGKCSKKKKKGISLLGYCTMYSYNVFENT